MKLPEETQLTPGQGLPAPVCSARLYELGGEPIDVQASKLMWKSPWWAKAPIEKRKKIREAFKFTTVEDFVDCYSAPPSGTLDRRGLIIEFHEGHLGVITGFGEQRRKSREASPNQRSKGKGSFRNDAVNYWWVLTEYGKYVSLRWRTVRKGSWKLIQEQNTEASDR